MVRVVVERIEYKYTYGETYELMSTDEAGICKCRHPKNLSTCFIPERLLVRAEGFQRAKPLKTLMLVYY